MNIFVILLMALFMAGYYFMDAPNVSVLGASKSDAAETAELKSVLACVLRAHSDALLLDKRTAAGQKTVFSTEIPCVEKYDITTRKICGDDRRITAECVPDKTGRFISNYIVTTTDIITEIGAGKILGLLAEDYPHAANFGIITLDETKTSHILSSGGTKREISKSIAKEAAFKDGQLAYITQYKVGGDKSPAAVAQSGKIRCGVGESPVFRQNKWSCVKANVAPICSGDFIWDIVKSACVPDPNKRLFCKSNQTAVLVGDVWECIGAEEKGECPAGYNAEMNYGTMEWECVPNPKTGEKEGKKCDKIYDRVYGGGTATVRGSLAGCNDCEHMIVYDDCTAECVPDAAAIYKKSCYDGTCRNFYFGFPDAKYIAGARKNLPQLADVGIPLAAPYSRNRKFNCMECPFGIDSVASFPPYVIICQ